MSSNPFLQDEPGGAGATTATTVAGITIERPSAEISVEAGRKSRQLCIYPARAGYDLRRELDFLTNRALEGNVFFSARFMAPAMPRLEDKEIRLMIMRDEDERRSRLRFLMPFSIERPGFAIGSPIIRAWANDFGPLGTPLLDQEGAAETLDNLLETLGSGKLDLPSVLIIPSARLDGPFVQLLRAVAVSRGLPITETDPFERPMLKSTLDGTQYLKQSLSSKHLRERRRQLRLLGGHGEVTYDVARQPGDIRYRMEEFLALEASGWKGRRRTAMVVDRYRAAFAREAITDLAETDNVRIHTLNLNGEAIASMIVFIQSGTAYTWKTAYNETFSSLSPGQLLMDELTALHLEDPNITISDSCAVEDHPVMSRLWRERCRMGTLIVGLSQSSDRDMRQVETQLHLYNETRNIARIVRNKLRGMTRGR
ncbi:GNAT family N-acetyltransferase [Hoeflea prorocentri]|uniref:GNAT family N-acetyltransferase n=1 Tax=Hoeflea prorocentri TaxID=1922333 RepID=A0A9X3UN27_9HYPH|nr:GNAT family N-acetyltransferase [Hoeflea prorocentri]MCY6383664.1 GNAT family N-acetyltransferase [Hoeflea prorocentri]MDA5401464.1 GNAT family N-acetyltransferase [Hoeflea prorocentri]